MEPEQAPGAGQSNDSDGLPLDDLMAELLLHEMEGAEAGAPPPLACEHVSRPAVERPAPPPQAAEEPVGEHASPDVLSPESVLSWLAIGSTSTTPPLTIETSTAAKDEAPTRRPSLVSEALPGLVESLRLAVDRAHTPDVSDPACFDELLPDFPELLAVEPEIPMQLATDPVETVDLVSASIEPKEPASLGESLIPAAEYAQTPELSHPACIDEGLPDFPELLALEPQIPATQRATDAGAPVPASFEPEEPPNLVESLSPVAEHAPTPEDSYPACIDEGPPEFPDLPAVEPEFPPMQLASDLGDLVPASFEPDEPSSLLESLSPAAEVPDPACLDDGLPEFPDFPVVEPEIQEMRLATSPVETGDLVPASFEPEEPRSLVESLSPAAEHATTPEVPDLACLDDGLPEFPDFPAVEPEIQEMQFATGPVETCDLVPASFEPEEPASLLASVGPTAGHTQTPEVPDPAGLDEGLPEFPDLPAFEPEIPAMRQDEFHAPSGARIDAGPLDAGAAPFDESPQAYDGCIFFLLDQIRYAVPMRDVRELNTVPPITAVPLLPKFVKGVTNLRGEILPVLDLRMLLGMKPAEQFERGRILVVRSNAADSLAALVVDEVRGTVDLEPRRMQPADQGMGEGDDQIVRMLDIDKLFAVPELARLG